MLKPRRTITHYLYYHFQRTDSVCTHDEALAIPTRTQDSCLAGPSQISLNPSIEASNNIAVPVEELIALTSFPLCVYVYARVHICMWVAELRLITCLGRPNLNPATTLPCNPWGKEFEG